MAGYQRILITCSLRASSTVPVALLPRLCGFSGTSLVTRQQVSMYDWLCLSVVVWWFNWGLSPRQGYANSDNFVSMDSHRPWVQDRHLPASVHASLIAALVSTPGVSDYCWPFVLDQHYCSDALNHNYLYRICLHVSCWCFLSLEPCCPCIYMGLLWGVITCVMHGCPVILHG